MTAAFGAAMPATGPGAWSADTRPEYRGGESYVYLSGVVMQTEASSDLTTEALAPLTTE